MDPLDTRFDKFLDFNDNIITANIYDDDSRDIDEAIRMKKSNRNK